MLQISGMEPGALLTAAGVIFSVVASTTALAYEYGRHRQESEVRAKRLDEQEEQLGHIEETVEDVADAVTNVINSVSAVRTELKNNREDIRQQHRLVHNQLLDGEKCGNEQCVFCYPENNQRGVDVDPIPKSVRERFDGPGAGSDD